MIGLENTKSELDVEFFSSTSEGIQMLGTLRAAIASGENGAVCIWIDDDGVYRGNRQYCCDTKAEFQSENIEELSAWLDENLPKIQ
jgi:hypothetical protein